MSTKVVRAQFWPLRGTRHVGHLKLFPYFQGFSGYIFENASKYDGNMID